MTVVAKHRELELHWGKKYGYEVMENLYWGDEWDGLECMDHITIEAKDHTAATTEFLQVCADYYEDAPTPAPNWEAQARYDEEHGTINGEDPGIVAYRELVGEG